MKIINSCLSRVSKLRIVGLLTLLGTPFVHASDIVEVVPLTSQILVVHFDDGYAVHHKKGQKRTDEYVVVDPLNIALAQLTGSYLLASPDDSSYWSAREPLSIGRKSKGTEFGLMCDSYDNSCINNRPDYASEHWIYLFLADGLQSGKTYTLTMNGLAKNQSTFTFKYNEAELHSEAIHVNNLGYSTSAPAKYGYLYHWMGDRGSLDLKSFEGQAFQLYNVDSKQVVYTGQITFRKPKTQAETGQPNETPNNNFNGADVWECDFSGFNTPGNYRLVVPGMGSSFPFKIDADAYREAFYWTMKGLYQNRSGIVLKAPYTDFPRPAPHHPKLTPGFAGRLKYTTFRAFDLSSGDGNAATDKAKVEAGYRGELENTWGWYQDAGDWDGYYTHSHVPAYLLFLYEAAPQKFTDNELNIPESGNGIPDLLDEAAWLLNYYKRAKDEVKKKGWGTGGIPGARVFGDFWGGDERPDGTTIVSWEDTHRDWYVTGEDVWMTYKYAALTAQMAYIMKSIRRPREFAQWLAEAVLAYEWAKKNTKPEDEATRQGYQLKHMRLYASAALYRLTKIKKYHEAFLAEAVANIGINADKQDVMFAQWLYLQTPGSIPTDEGVRNQIRTASQTTADDILISTAEKRAARFGGNFYFPMLVGQPTTPMVMPGVYGYVATQATDPGKAAQYLKYLHTTADYFLGCNPLNTTWISGVGERYPVGIFHLDWWYSGKDQVMQGIVPYGPWKVQDFGPLGWWNPNWAYTDAKGNPRIYPTNVNDWPGHERWFDQRTSPLTGEFTIHQNTVVAAFVYGFLTGDKGSVASLSAQAATGESGDTLDVAVFPNPTDGLVNIRTLTKAAVDRIEIRTVDGKAVGDAVPFNKAGEDYQVDMTSLHLKSGMYLLRIFTSDGRQFTRKVVFNK